MRVVLTGATGGIGQPLTETLAAKHEVAGVVRSTPPLPDEDSSTRYVSYADRASLTTCFAQADVVIHAAIDWKAKGKRLEPANLQLTQDVLQIALSGPCRLFVFFSSMVVYSGTQPADDSGYREDQELVLDDSLDAYTRMKIRCERMVTQACEQAGVPYLILRPTIVLGPGLSWSRFATWLAKRLPVGLRGRSLNLIHVDDLCRYVDRLIDLMPKNEIFNLGGDNYQSEQFFDAFGAQAGHRMRYLPDPAERLLTSRLPSTLWVFKQNVLVDCGKIEAFTGIRASAGIDQAVRPNPMADAKGESLATLRSIQASGRPFRAYGLGYSLRLTPFRPARSEKRVMMEPYRGIVALHDDQVTVRTGTLLTDLERFLDQADLTLATLPEFTGLTAGACFFVDVHGSSNEYFCLRDLITEVKYLDKSGTEVRVTRDDAQWHWLREQKHDVFLTEVTFKCDPSGFLTNRLEWIDDEVLEDYILTRHRENLSTTVQWFPRQGKCLTYNINRAADPPASFVTPRMILRPMDYRSLKQFLRLRMKGTDTVYGRYADVLGSWKDLPFRKSWQKIPARKSQPQLCDMELCLSLDDGVRLVLALKDEVSHADVVLPKHCSVGIRFSYRTSANSEPEGFVWVEVAAAGAKRLDRLAAFARDVCVHPVAFHQGKYVPPAA